MIVLGDLDDEGRTATRRVAVSLFTANDWESTGIARFSLGLETVKSVVAQAKTGTNQRSQDARFGNPLFGGRRSKASPPSTARRSTPRAGTTPPTCAAAAWP